MRIFLFIAATLAAVSANTIWGPGLINRGIPQNVMQLNQPGLIQREMLHPGLVGHPGLIQREMIHPGMIAQPAPMMMAHPAPMMMAHPAPMIDLRELPVPYFHTEILPEPYIHIEGPAGSDAPAAEPYIHIDGPSGSDAPAAEPYVHVDGPAGSDAPAALPYVHEEGAAGSDAPAAVPYIHIEGPGAPLAEPYIHIEPLPQLQALDGRALAGLALGLPVDARIDARIPHMMGGITGVHHVGNVIGGPVLDAGLVGLPQLGGVRHLGAVPAGLAIGATHGLPLDAGMMRTWGPAPAVHAPLRWA